MAVTFAAVRLEMLRLLSEPADTTAGEVTEADGSGTLAESEDTFLSEANAAAAQITRTVYPVAARASGVFSASTRSVLLSALTLTGTDTGALWCARGVYLNSIPLDYTEVFALERQYPTVAVQAGTPACWYDDGATERIGVGPFPELDSAILVEGFRVPARILAAGSFDFAPDDLLYTLLPLLAAVRVCRNMQEDSRLAARLPVLSGEYSRQATEVWGRIPAPLRAWRFPVEPAA